MTLIQLSGGGRLGTFAALWAFFLWKPFPSITVYLPTIISNIFAAFQNFLSKMLTLAYKCLKMIASIARLLLFVTDTELLQQNNILTNTLPS
jgi:hypothetical protein